MTALIWVTLGGLALTVGDIIFKFWIERTLPYFSLYYIGGLAVYLVGLIFLVESFKTENIAVASVIFVLINITILAIFSWLYFGDKLSILKIAGLLLAMLSVVLLEID